MVDGTAHAFVDDAVSVMDFWARVFRDGLKI